MAGNKRRELERHESDVAKKLATTPISLVAFVAEYIAMTLFVIIGCGSAMGIAGTDGWILHVSLTFGWAITALAYSIGFYSGGHINCAVTLGLVLTKNCSVQQGLANFIAQMFGSLSGASVLCMMYDKDADKTGGLGSNGVGKDVKWYNALVGEIMMTFLLVFVVLKTAIHPGSMGNRSQACLAIGFAVFLAHSVLIPLDGCSINPTRSLGPAIIAQIRYEDSKSFDDMWIFLCGPLLGAALAAGAYELMKRVGEIEENPETDIILAVQLGQPTDAPTDAHTDAHTDAPNCAAPVISKEEDRGREPAYSKMEEKKTTAREIVCL